MNASSFLLAIVIMDNFIFVFALTVGKIRFNTGSRMQHAPLLTRYKRRSFHVHLSQYVQK